MIFNRDFTKTNPIRNRPLGMAEKQAIQNFTLMATQECVLGASGLLSWTLLASLTGMKISPLAIRRKAVSKSS